MNVAHTTAANDGMFTQCGI